MRSHLLEGKVRHRRSRPFVYTLEHDVFYLALDLDELDEVPRRVRLLRHNRPDLLSFRDSDHLDPPAVDLREAIRAHLRADGVDPDDWRITLITNPRVFGYVFNPASFFLCRDAAGELQIVIVEVHNTHNERHLYTLRRPLDGPGFSASMDKDFYVSPFIDIVGRYTVRVRDEGARLRISINEEDAVGLLLHASVDLARRPLTDRMIARMLVRHPFATHKTIALIHWHALRLWRRGAHFYRHGAAAR